LRSLEQHAPDARSLARALALPRLVAAAQGWCSAAHFGAYDYTAACDITASCQHLLHPWCDFARHEARAAGLTLDELRTRSFLEILQGRRGSGPS